MAQIMLRVRLITGDEVTEHAITALAADCGMIRARHGDRPFVLYGARRGGPGTGTPRRGPVAVPTARQRAAICRATTTGRRRGGARRRPSDVIGRHV
jgi:hypothetical protein